MSNLIGKEIIGWEIIRKNESKKMIEKKWNLDETKKESKLKKVLTEIVKIGGWIIIALEKLIEVL